MSEHSKHPITPSNLFRPMLCPASANRERGLPDSDNAAAAEGRLLHSAIACRLGGKATVVNLNGEQEELIAICEEICEEICGKIGFCQKRVTERKFVVPGLRRNGIADLLALDPAWQEITVVDWKFGRVAPHFSAAENPQMLPYAVGLHAKYGVDRVRVYVVYPRLWGEERKKPGLVQSAVYEGDADYWAGLEAAIRAIVEAADKPDAPAIAGEVQCEWCRATLDCDAHKKWAMLPAIVDSRELSPANIAETLDLRPRLNAWNKRMAKVVDLGRTMLEAGVEIPGFELGHPSRTRKVTDYDQARNVLETAGMPTEILNKSSTLSLSQLEKAAYAALHTEDKKITQKEVKDRIAEHLSGDLIEYGENAAPIKAKKKGD